MSTISASESVATGRERFLPAAMGIVYRAGRYFRHLYLQASTIIVAGVAGWGFTETVSIFGAARPAQTRTRRSSELAGLAPLGISLRFGATEFTAAHNHPAISPTASTGYEKCAGRFGRSNS